MMRPIGITLLNLCGLASLRLSVRIGDRSLSQNELSAIIADCRQRSASWMGRARATGRCLRRSSRRRTATAGETGCQKPNSSGCQRFGRGSGMERQVAKAQRLQGNSTVRNIAVPACPPTICLREGQCLLATSRFWRGGTPTHPEVIFERTRPQDWVGSCLRFSAADGWLRLRRAMPLR